MKMCYICGKNSVVQEFVWKHGKCILVERCLNPYCKTHNPYLWRQK